jgi:hypothetical protein
VGSQILPDDMSFSRGISISLGVHWQQMFSSNHWTSTTGSDYHTLYSRFEIDIARPLIQSDDSARVEQYRRIIRDVQCVSETHHFLVRGRRKVLICEQPGRPERHTLLLETTFLCSDLADLVLQFGHDIRDILLR